MAKDKLDYVYMCNNDFPPDITLKIYTDIYW